MVFKTVNQEEMKIIREYTFQNPIVETNPHTWERGKEAQPRE